MRRIEGSEEIGRRIRALRRSKGLTLARLANLIDASATHLSQIERGKVTNPGTEILSRIATALETSFSIDGYDPIAKRDSGLVYKSPFTLEELQEMPDSSEAALISIKNLLADSRLNSKQRKKIAETLVSMAEWLRDQGLRDTS